MKRAPWTINYRRVATFRPARTTAHRCTFFAMSHNCKDHS